MLEVLFRHLKGHGVNAAQWLPSLDGVSWQGSRGSSTGVIQYLRTATEQISSAGGAASIGGGETAHIGDVVVTRRNDRRLETSGREPVRNRESWTVERIGDDGSLTVSSNAEAAA